MKGRFSIPAMAMAMAMAMALALSLAGCSALDFSPKQSDRWLVLDLPPAPAVAAPRPPRHDATLLLAPTTAPSFYDSQDIVFSTSPGTRALYQFNHWTEAPSLRIGKLLAARLQRAGAFRSVAAANSGLRGRWLLRTQIDEIYHDASQPPGSARLVLTAELSDPGKRDLVARRTFTAAVPVERFDADGAARGLGTALGTVLDELAEWVDRSAVD